MKKMLPPHLMCILLLLLACEKSKDEEMYYIRFQLEENDSSNTVFNVQSTPQIIERYGYDDSNYIRNGIGLGAEFSNPSDNEMNQLWSFSFSIKIPKNEFIIDSGKIKWNNPGNFPNHLPSGNIFEDSTVFLFTYFHEDVRTFCTSISLDTSFHNRLEINNSAYYIDDHGYEALDIHGTFALRYNPVCLNDRVTLKKGAFRLKFLMNDTIP